MVAPGAAVDANTDAAVFALYTDDVVVSKDDPALIGVVTRTAWESDDEADDDYEQAEQEDEEANHHGHGHGHGDAHAHDAEPNDSDAEHESEYESESEEAEERLQPGQIRVLWIPPVNHRPDFQLSSSLHASEVNLVDRSLLHGDVVSRIEDSDNNSELGQVYDVNVELTVRMSDHSVRVLQASEIRTVHPFVTGVHVWRRGTNVFGVVEECLCDVTVRFSDGAIAVIERATSSRLHDVTDYALSEEQQDEADQSLQWFPGQKVNARFAVWQTAQWLSGTKQSAVNDNHEGTVIDVQPSLVVVSWLSGSDSSVPPESEMNPSELHVLEEFEASKYIVGDRVLVNAPQSADAGPVSEEPRSRGARRRARAANDLVRQCGLIIGTRTRASVHWQSGLRSNMVDSRQLLPRTAVMDSEFFVDDFVLVRGSMRLATVKSVDSAQRMATVKFLSAMTGDVERGDHELPEPNAREYNAGETISVSVFDLRCHPRLELGLGSVCVRIPGDGESPEDFNSESRPLMGMAGQVIGLDDGLITVKWADENNLVSTVRPDQIYLLDQVAEHGHEGDEYDGEYDEAADGENEDEYDNDFAHDNASNNNHDNNRTSNPGLDVEYLDNVPVLRVNATAGSVIYETIVNAATAIASSINRARRRHSHPDAQVPEQSAQSQSEVQPESQPEPQPQLQPANGGVEENDEDDDEESQEARSALAYSSFRMLEHCRTHHYLTQSPSSAPQLARRLQIEFRTLSRSLPDGIHVVSYEDRTDLLSVIIAGPINTPYFLSLFEFDVAIPADYPHSPPRVHYYSYNMRLHPNLYADGKVCLSLLGTWAGSESQRWSPSTSTLLQLLVSLQGLVLGESLPYFLEAGYNKFRGSPQSVLSAITYNEQVLGLSVAHSAAQLTSPSDHFHIVIQRHFADENVRRLYRELHEWSNTANTSASSDTAHTITESQSTDSAEEQKAESPRVPLVLQFSIPLEQQLLESDPSLRYRLTTGFLHSLRSFLSKLEPKLAQNYLEWLQRKESESNRPNGASANHTASV